MKLPNLTPAEYKKKWADLIEENMRLKRKLEQAEKDVEDENQRFGQAVSLRVFYLQDRKLEEDFQQWYNKRKKEAK